MSATRELPEIRYASKGRLMEKEMRKTATEQDRKSNVRKRQIDRNIYLTTKELNDIQTRTPSPTRAVRRVGTPHITVSDIDTPHHNNNNNNNNNDNNNNDNNDHHHHHHSPRVLNTNNDDDKESESEPHLVHLRARTRRNLLLSQKLSRSLERMEQKRAQSPRLPPSACRERGAYRPVSCQSMDDLHRAATVLKFTQHEEEVQQLLSSVSLKERMDHA